MTRAPEEIEKWQRGCALARADKAEADRDIVIKEREAALADAAHFKRWYSVEKGVSAKFHASFVQEQALRHAALARLGAVQRETLERAATIVRRAGHSLADEIALLHLGPDAAAALERALQAEREACADVAKSYGFGHGIGPMIAAAILARGQKDNADAAP